MKKLLLLAMVLLSGFASAQTTTVYSGVVKDLSQVVVPTGQVSFELRPGLSSAISGSARFVPSTIYCSINQATAGASAAVRAANSVTISGLTGHTFVANDIITMTSMTDVSFNGTFTIGSTTATSITYPQTAGGATTGSGIISALRSSPGPGSCTVMMNTALTPSGTSYKICIQPNTTSPGSCFNDYAVTATRDISTIVPTPTTSPAYTFVDLHSTQTVDGNKTFTGSTTFTGNLTFGALTVSTINANAVVSRTANPASSGIIELASIDTECWRKAANNGDVCLSDPGAAAAGTGNLADLFKWTGGGAQFAAYVDQSAAPANSGVVRTGNNVCAVASRNAAGSGDVCGVKIDASNLVDLGSGPFLIPAASDTAVGKATTDTLTNKTIDTAGPNTIKINGNTLSATAGTATVTVPNSTDTLVGKATTDTLTNKTLTGAASGNAVTLLNAQGALGALTGNAADQTVYTYTIPAGTIAAGKGFRVTVFYVHTTGNGLVTYKMTLGSTALDTIAVTDNANAVSEMWQGAIINNASVQNAQTWSRLSYIGVTAAVASGVTAGTSAENTANSLVLKWTFNAANTEQVTAKQWLVELIQ